LNAEFNASSLCDCVAQIFVRTLRSRSSTVKLLRTKNRSFWSDPPSTAKGAAAMTSGVEVAGVWAAVLPFSSFASSPSPPDVLASWTTPACGADAAGPVGAVTPAGPSTVLLRSRLTRRTDMNLESCSFCCAAEQDCSSV
jgi:hypothetical protein